MTDKEFLVVVEEQIWRLKREKEALRQVLNEKGFNIPMGQTLGEWIPYIRKSDGT